MSWCLFDVITYTTIPTIIGIISIIFFLHYHNFDNYHNYIDVGPHYYNVLSTVFLIVALHQQKKQLFRKPNESNTALKFGQPPFGMGPKMSR